MTLGATNGAMGITCGGALTLASTNTGNVNIGTTGSSSIFIGASGFSTTINGGVKTTSISSLTINDTLYLGDNQTNGTGQIVIGGSKTSGYIAIGNPSNSGHSVIINSVTAFNQGVTLNNANAYGIQTSTTTFTAGSTNIGYQSSGTGTAVGSLTTTISSACITISNLAVGFYIITLSGNITGFGTTANAAVPTITVTGGTNNMTKYNVGSTTSTTGFSYSGPVQITSSTNSITLQFATSASTANMAAAPTYSYIRIA
jgi:hypothetical protein